MCICVWSTLYSLKSPEPENVLSMPSLHITTSEMIILVASATTGNPKAVATLCSRHAHAYEKNASKSGMYAMLIRNNSPLSVCRREKSINLKEDDTKQKSRGKKGEGTCKVRGMTFRSHTGCH
jgi:hypothetical protein